jgi:hypothetical protein
MAKMGIRRLIELTIAMRFDGRMYVIKPYYVENIIGVEVIWIRISEMPVTTNTNILSKK